MKINADWHSKHKMPANPSVDERTEWHIAHVKNCTCRPIPSKLGKLLEKHSPAGYQKFA